MLYLSNTKLSARSETVNGIHKWKSDRFTIRIRLTDPEDIKDLRRFRLLRERNIASQLSGRRPYIDSAQDEYVHEHWTTVSLKAGETPLELTRKVLAALARLNGRLATRRAAERAEQDPCGTCTTDNTLGNLENVHDL